MRGCEEALEGDADAQSPEEFEENRLQAYNRLILAETETEAQQRSQVASDATLTEEQRQRELAKLEQRFYYRRIINSLYFKQLKSLILSKDYS